MDLEPGPRPARIAEVVGPPELGEHREPALVLQSAARRAAERAGTNSRRLSRKRDVLKTPSPKSRPGSSECAGVRSLAAEVVGCHDRGNSGCGSVSRADYADLVSSRLLEAEQAGPPGRR